jgi:hypothetical protein
MKKKDEGLINRLISSKDTLRRVKALGVARKEENQGADCRDQNHDMSRSAGVHALNFRSGTCPPRKPKRFVETAVHEQCRRSPANNKLKFV